jgi:hypothetical protein
MQTGIDIAGDARHASPGGEASSTDPVDDQLVAKAACDLPSQDPRRRRQASALGQWMGGQKFIYSTNLRKHFFISVALRGSAYSWARLKSFGGHSPSSVREREIPIRPHPLHTPRDRNCYEVRQSRS